MEPIISNINNLNIGDILAEDIFANTQYPIVLKNTRISHEHLHIFQAFNIKEIPIISDELNEISKLLLDDSNNNLEIQPVVEQFEEKYHRAVDQFKKLFSNWEAGAKVDITKIRGIILPLVEDILEDRTILFDLNNISKTKDYLYHHCIATGLVSAAISQKMGYERGYVLQLAIAGTLVDSGMAKIPTRIRGKNGPLNENEFIEIRKHPIYSYQMIKDLPALKAEMKVAIYQHHERLDGSGYPSGVKNGTISIFSQIIAVADTFHAMTSERLYRSKESPFKVIEMIKESEFGKFNIKVVQALIDLVAGLPIGTKIELSNLERGEIMFINSYAPTRPLIKLSNTGEIIDLSNNRSLYISRVITNE